jgi:hypothetical protein
MLRSLPLFGDFMIGFTLSDVTQIYRIDVTIIRPFALAPNLPDSPAPLFLVGLPRGRKNIGELPRKWCFERDFRSKHHKKTTFICL